ncbi:hypothetical protein MSG28_007871 [Choristoneura fumiferana]|uniref:Uncharacterized protein n=1 Tax=Choristoneura fumiferana TaxID=7141 RepID=A0ACC0J958_CHOFU|nr:hypothetical protein MSG28_007871 [Choristoneura fumiferana]
MEHACLADSVSTKGSGGGEGAPVQPPAPVPEEKTADSIKTEPAEQKVEVKPETITESVPEVKPAANPEPETAKIPDTEVKTEVKAEIESKIEAEIKAEVDSKPEGKTTVEIPIKAELPVATEATVVAEVPVAVESTATTGIKDEKLPEAKQDSLSNGDAAGSTDWQQKELELLQKIQELEKVRSENSEDSLKMQLKVKEEEVDLLKARVKNLETELQAALSKPGSKNQEMIEKIKQQHEELLSKARGMIFDKTKMVKNQELQIEALTTQVQSLKDINLITKDLLEIRNSEIKAMEDRLVAMEARFKAEKDRYSLVLQRAQTSSNINDDLKQEYMTQLKIFKELRLKYEQKVEALVAENNKLKLDALKNGGGPSTGAPK